MEIEMLLHRKSVWRRILSRVKHPLGKKEGSSLETTQDPLDTRMGRQRAADVIAKWRKLANINYKGSSDDDNGTTNIDTRSEKQNQMKKKPWWKKLFAPFTHMRRKRRESGNNKGSHGHDATTAGESTGTSSSLWSRPKVIVITPRTRINTTSRSSTDLSSGSSKDVNSRPKIRADNLGRTNKANSESTTTTKGIPRSKPEVAENSTTARSRSRSTTHRGQRSRPPVRGQRSESSVSSLPDDRATIQLVPLVSDTGSVEFVMKELSVRELPPGEEKGFRFG